MAGSEFQQYEAFVDRTLLEVKRGLELDNHAEGSCKRRVCDALSNSTNRSPAQKVIDGRFILGGDDSSYLANGLAMLWSTVGYRDEKEGELGLAPAALYSPDAVNGIRRGLLAAFEKKNKELRKDARNQLANLMGALVPILELFYDKNQKPDADAYEEMRGFLQEGKVSNVRDRNKLFRFLVKVRDATNLHGVEDVQASSLAVQILRKVTGMHKTALQAAEEQQRVELEKLDQRRSKEVEVLQAELASVEMQLSRLRTERDGSLEELQKQSGQIRRLAAEIRAKEKRVNGQAAVIRGMEEQLETGDEESKRALQQEREQLEKEQALLDDCNQKLTKSLEARDGLSLKIESLQEQVRAETSKTEAMKAAHAERLESLKREHSEALAKRDAAYGEAAEEAKKATKQALAEQAERLEARERSLNKQELEQLNDRLVDVQSKARKLAEEQVERIQQHSKDLAEQKGAHEQEVRELEMQCREKLLELENATKSEFDQLKESYGRIQLELQGCELEQDRLGQKLKDCVSKGADSAEEQTRLQNALTKAENQAAVLAGELEAKVRAYNEEAKTTDDSYVELQESLSERFAERMKQLEAARQSKADLMAKLGEFPVLWEDPGAEKALQEKEDEIVELEEKLAKMAEELKLFIEERMRLAKAVEAFTTPRSTEDPRSAAHSWLQAAEEEADAQDELERGNDTKRQAIKDKYTDLIKRGIDPTRFTGRAEGNAWINTAVCRGLVGQRGPTEPANIAHCPQDGLLPYALPDIQEVVKHMLPAHLLLESTPDPTDEQVDRALAAFDSLVCADGAKRQRVDDGSVTDVASPAVISQALSLFQDDFAITGMTPAAELPAERCGVELPHEVRWIPRGPRGATMARVAVLEHAIARCGQLAAREGLRPSVAASLRHASAALKLKQLEPLYELHEAVECNDNPHPLGTGTTRLVTRPCAVVRGTLSFPLHPGVATLPERDEASDAPLTKDASLSQAMAATAAATAALRNDLRRQGHASNVYVAPEAKELAFRSAPTGAPPSPEVAAKVRANGAEGGRVSGLRAASMPDPSRVPEGYHPATLAVKPTTDDRVPSTMFANTTFRRIVNRLIVCAAALDVGDGDGGALPDPVAAFLDVAQAPDDGAGAVTPQTRRQGLWAEMQRHVAVSQDRLWVFIRLVGGKIGGNASEVITLADEATLKAAKAIQEQRAEIARRVSDMQSKIVETVISSMLKNSKMTMEYKKSSLAVIDAEARKELKDLETGASGRPFFEANVALKNLATANEGPPTLEDVLSGLANVGEQMQATLERTLSEPSAASASLVELSHPANSYFVMMRGDALAAVRAAHEKLNCELGMQGARRRLSAWELIEGGCTVLTERFADLCGYLLVQARTSTGVSAMYVSHQSIYTNASQARVALARLAAAAHAYLASVAPPDFHAENPQQARFRALTQGERVRDIDVTQRVVPHSRAPLYAPIPSTGWYQYGGFRKRT